jgi:hypothetical protein
MASVLDDYFASLKRLKENKPEVLPKESPINKDTVALEAGRKRGSIKKSRHIFEDLIAAIDSASSEAQEKKGSHERRVSKLSSEKTQYKELYEESLGRELSLIYEIKLLKEEVKRLKRGSLKIVK